MALRFPFIILALLLAMQSATASAQGQLGWLAGRWAGSGTSMGKSSISTFEAAPALGGAFVEFRYRLSQPFPFEGRAFYKERPNGSWEAAWFDSRGVPFPITATVVQQELTSDWGSAATERGQTTYRLLSDGKLQIIDRVLTKEGKWREFARQTFTRLP